VRRNLGLILALGAALAVGIASISTATGHPTICVLSTTTAASECPPSLLVKFGGSVTPEKLPKHKTAPIAVKLWGTISNDDGSQPPALREATVDFDKNGALDATGLPVCKRSQLEARDTSAARHVCRSSIVGTGTAHVAIESGSLPIPLTLFNGGTRVGTTTLFIYTLIPMSTPPTPTISTVKLRKVRGGRYGLQAVTKIPRIANGSGSLLDFSFKIKRIFEYKGKKRSYVMARCSNGNLSAAVRTFFSNGETLTGAVARSCMPQG
jgi:hypothetical protein